MNLNVISGLYCERLFAMIAKRLGLKNHDLRNRDLCVGCVRSHYGEVSMWILSIEGTPARGTILFDTNDWVPRKCFLHYEDRVVSLTGDNYEVVDSFIRENEDFLLAKSRQDKSHEESRSEPHYRRGCHQTASIICGHIRNMDTIDEALSFVDVFARVLGEYRDNTGLKTTSLLDDASHRTLQFLGMIPVTSPQSPASASATPD